MPIENERKYLIKKDCESEVADKSSDKLEVYQGYLNLNPVVRIRKSIDSFSTSYVFTFKQDVAGECVEIEKFITKQDFRKLWTLAKNKIEKIRYLVPEKDHDWEIDFFKCGGVSYIAVAEVELPESLKKPKSIPKLVKDNLLFSVKRNDDRFYNTKLDNVEYALDLVRQYTPRLG